MAVTIDDRINYPPCCLRDAASAPVAAIAFFVSDWFPTLRGFVSLTLVTLIVSTLIEFGRQAAMPLAMVGFIAFKSWKLSAWF